jgi:hypothetical protein
VNHPKEGAMRLASITGLLVAAAVGLGACGGDDGLSKADYVKQANAICRDANTQLGKIAEPTDVAGIATYVASAKKVTSVAVDKMAALEPPEELRADHKAHVADGRKVVTLADDLAAAAKSGDQAAFQRISQQGDRMDQTSDARAKKMGLGDCADDS